MKQKNDYEQHLLSNPFDTGVRGDYAQFLLDDGSFEEALIQFEILQQQSSEDVTACMGAVRALNGAGRHDEALKRYAVCRTMVGFEPDETLEALAQNAVPANSPPALRVVSGDAGNIVTMPATPETKIRFTDVIGADDLKKTIRLKIIEPFLNPGLFQRFRKQAGGGILLFGPPGCGKTMMARALANEINAEFMSVGISDILNMWRGESEQNLVSVFEKARSQAPAVLFFDEIDALAFSRSKAHSESTRTVVNEFLAQLDGLGPNNKDVLVLAATNMPWDVDPAMRRPGRFSRQIFVPPPDANGRQHMFQNKLRGVPQQDLDLGKLAVQTENFSGADIDGLIELATENALYDALDNNNERPLQQADFNAALQDLVPSTLDWLRTARNLIKYGGSDRTYKDVEVYLKNSGGI